MSFDDSREVFLEEARDLIAAAEAALLALETEPENMDRINEVFRGLHTIKGSGAMFGYSEVSDFTHEVENLFDAVRQGRVPVTSDIIEIGLQAADHISRLLDGRADPSVRDLIHEALGQFDLGSPAPAPKANPAPQAVEPASAPRSWKISVRPQAEILHRGVRLGPIFAELGDLGPVRIRADFSAVPDLEALDPTLVAVSWTIELTTGAPEGEIRQCFLFIEDYAQISLDPVPPRRRASDLVPQKGAEPSQEAASIRVRKEKLDVLIDTVGELVILQARLEQESARGAEGQYQAISETLGRLTADLRDTTMSIRMVPLEELFTGYQRLIRDLGRALGKEVDLNVSGTSTELDKNIIESLKDPLLHIIRNAADHGIEVPEVRERAGKPRRGTVTLGARQVGSRVEIVVSDDGSGLNLGKIKARAVANGLLPATETNEDRIMGMIFEPGFSTAETTTDLSGRGVGMDVVKRNIEKLRGTVSLGSQPGQGTRITLSIPLTLVIIEGLLVRVGGSDYVISLAQVQECVDPTDDLRVGLGTNAMVDLRGKTIPILSVRAALGLAESQDSLPRLVIVQSDAGAVGLAVDAVLGRKQVVIKPLSRVLRKLKILSGATILGDGSVALILDVAELVKARLDQTP